MDARTISAHRSFLKACKQPMKNLEGIEAVDRRGFMAYMSALGLGGTLLPGLLWAQLQERGP